MANAWIIDVGSTIEVDGKEHFIEGAEYTIDGKSDTVDLTVTFTDGTRIYTSDDWDALPQRVEYNRGIGGAWVYNDGYSKNDDYNEDVKKDVKNDLIKEEVTSKHGYIVFAKISRAAQLAIVDIGFLPSSYFFEKDAEEITAAIDKDYLKEVVQCFAEVFAINGDGIFKEARESNGVWMVSFSGAIKLPFSPLIDDLLSILRKLDDEFSEGNSLSELDKW